MLTFWNHGSVGQNGRRRKQGRFFVQSGVASQTLARAALGFKIRGSEMNQFSKNNLLV